MGHVGSKDMHVEFISIISVAQIEHFPPTSLLALVTGWCQKP